MGDSAGIMHEGAPLRLTEWTSCGGCAAKWGKDLLAGLVDELPRSVDPALIIGLAPFDDAAVYRVSDDVALVSTTDFFPPLVDDATDFGAIAAANACSDVFAMGGRVVTNDMAEQIVKKFLETPFEAGRHARRVGQLSEIEVEEATHRES